MHLCYQKAWDVQPNGYLVAEEITTPICEFFTAKQFFLMNGSVLILHIFCIFFAYLVIFLQIHTNAYSVHFSAYFKMQRISHPLFAHIWGFSSVYFKVLNANIKKNLG